MHSHKGCHDRPPTPPKVRSCRRLELRLTLPKVNLGLVDLLGDVQNVG